MIQSHIDSIRDYGLVPKLERFFHLSDRSIELGSHLGFGYLSLMFSLRVGVKWERATWKRAG